MLGDAPYDVLYLVTEYLSVRDVEKLCCVNKRLRAAVGLNARFRDVRLYGHDWKMKLLCEILCRDDVAARVRRLTIEPWLVQPRTKTCVSRSENAWNYINKLFDSKYMEHQAEQRIQKRINKDIKRVTNVIHRLENLQEYRILLDERSSTYHRQLIRAFLSPTIELLAPKLNKLTLKVPFDLLQNLSHVRLPELRELNVNLCTGEARMEQIRDAFDGFFVFIHNLRSLEHLGISATSTSRYLDLSCFSARWGSFPELKSFSLCIPFDGGLLSYPECLYTHVLKPHAGKMEKLKLSTTCCAVSPGPRPPNAHIWIQRILKASFGTPFPRLREVELALRPLKASLNDLQTFLQRQAPTLEKLWLTDRALRNEELIDLFDSLCPPSVSSTGQNHVLENLRIKVDFLNVELLLLVARRFPRLKTLGLTFTDFGSDAELKGPRLNNGQKVIAFSQSLKPHFDTFATWGLRMLYITPPSFPWFRGMDNTLTQYFKTPFDVSELPSPQ